MTPDIEFKIAHSSKNFIDLDVDGSKKEDSDDDDDDEESVLNI